MAGLKILLPAICASLLWGGFTLPALAADSGDVEALQLTTPTKTNKVAAVLWTRRADRYTLQVVFPRETRIVILGDGRMADTARQHNPTVALWLLRADGTVIPARSATPLKTRSGQPAAEVAYSVSLPDGEQAVAAAIRIDDEYFIEPLR